MNKLDRRVVRTRRALREALIELALENGYEEISIRDLTERACIGYATFFRHYKSKDQLLSEVMRDTIYEFVEAARAAETLYDESLAIYRMLDRHRDTVSVGLSLPVDHPVAKPLWDEATGIVAELYSARDEETIPMEVSVNHVINSVAALFRWWLSEGNEYSPEQMATMQSELIIKVTESVALHHRSEGLRQVFPG